MSAIDRMKAHYAGWARQRMEVPELAKDGEPPLVVTWVPMTVADAQSVTKRGTLVGEPQIAVSVLIRKAQDEQGRPLFTEDNRHALMHEVDRALVERIAAAIIATPSREDLEKN